MLAGDLTYALVFIAHAGWVVVISLSVIWVISALFQLSNIFQFPETAGSFLKKEAGQPLAGQFGLFGFLIFLLFPPAHAAD